MQQYKSFGTIVPVIVTTCAQYDVTTIHVQNWKTMTSLNMTHFFTLPQSQISTDGSPTDIVFFKFYLQCRISKLTFFLHHIPDHPHFVRKSNMPNPWGTRKLWFRKCINWHQEPEMQQLIQNRGSQNRWRMRKFWLLDKCQHSPPTEVHLIIGQVRFFQFYLSED